MSGDAERYIFEAEWYDKVAYTLKKFYLYFFPLDNSVELVSYTLLHFHIYSINIPAYYYIKL